jgi:hypothetical protein
MASKKDEKISCALYVEGRKVTAQAVINGVVFEGELKELIGITAHAHALKGAEGHVHSVTELASQFTPEYISQGAESHFAVTGTTIHKRIEGPVRSMVELTSQFTLEEMKALSFTLRGNEVMMTIIKRISKDKFAALREKVKKIGGKYISQGAESYFTIPIKRD